MREGIYADDILHYDIMIEELRDRTGLSREICESVYDAISDIMIELGIMEVAGSNIEQYKNCSGLGFEGCDTCETQCLYR